MIAGVHILQEIFAIDVLTESNSILSGKDKGVLIQVHQTFKNKLKRLFMFFYLMLFYDC